MADIPGLISGAAKGKGLGSQFLKHIERTQALVYLIDGNSENINKQYNTLKTELGKYNSDLLIRPSLLLLTKSDLFKNEITDIPKDIKHITISSITKSNITKSIQSISSLL